MNADQTQPNRLTTTLLTPPKLMTVAELQKIHKESSYKKLNISLLVVVAAVLIAILAAIQNNNVELRQINSQLIMGHAELVALKVQQQISITKNNK